MQIPISDQIGQNLASFFPQAIEFIGEFIWLICISLKFAIGSPVGFIPCPGYVICDDWLNSRLRITYFYDRCIIVPQVLVSCHCFAEVLNAINVATVGEEVVGFRTHS